LKNRPVKASPQAYERWIKGLERELREMIGKGYDNVDVILREVLGE
jgi:hypothetical protein